MKWFQQTKILSRKLEKIQFFLLIGKLSLDSFKRSIETFLVICRILFHDTSEIER